MPIYLSKLLERVPPAVEARVRRIRDQARPHIQEALRTECRLGMRTIEETDNNRPGAQVPVEVSPGHPEQLEWMDFPDDFELILILGRYRGVLEQTVAGTNKLFNLRDELLSIPRLVPWAKASQQDLTSVRDWAAELLRLLEEHDPLKKVLAVNSDILGVYEYDASDLFADESSVNRATIRLYWGVIGLVSEWMGCGAEDLAIVVLTHELAHAYTQLGADIESRRWPACNFAKAEKNLKEGLAQYYTDRVLRRLERRYPGALKAYEQMLPKQSSAYRAHEPWVAGYSPESVRRAMLEVRRWHEGRLADFERRLEEAQKELHPERRGLA